MPREPIPLDDEELDTILAIARNQQSGRITEREVIELVRVYREVLKHDAEIINGAIQSFATKYAQSK